MAAEECDIETPSEASHLDVDMNPVEAVKSARLRYVNDSMPGIRRKRAGRGFRYTGPDGTIIRDLETLNRIKSLAIPPAWKDVWICDDPRGHIQATGRDARGRKQYRYHPDWRQVRDETKYARMVAFGASLPLIRECTARDLKKPGLPREKVLATVVQLLDLTLIRVGNEEYARTNETYGLTTLHQNQVEVNGPKVHFEFRGKGGIHHVIEVRNPRLARIVKRCEELPGYELFQYVDENGERRSVESADVNDYLEQITGQHFTAKDFRTWGGTVIAARNLKQLGTFDTEQQAKKNIVEAVRRTAQELGNTPAICRKSYIHPHILDAYLKGQLTEDQRDTAGDETEPGAPARLRPEERALLDVLSRAEGHAAASSGKRLDRHASMGATTQSH